MLIKQDKIICWRSKHPFFGQFAFLVVALKDLWSTTNGKKVGILYFFIYTISIFMVYSLIPWWVYIGASCVSWWWAYKLILSANKTFLVKKD